MGGGWVGAAAVCDDDDRKFTIKKISTGILFVF